MKYKINIIYFMLGSMIFINLSISKSFTELLKELQYYKKYKETINIIDNYLADYVNGQNRHWRVYTWLRNIKLDIIELDNIKEKK